MFKNILTFVAILCFASVAWAAGGATTFQFGPERDTLLAQSQVTNIGTSGYCMDFYQDTTGNVAAQVCDIDLVNEVVWSQNAQVRQIKVKALVAPDAGDYCTFAIEVAGVTIDSADTAATQLVSTVQALDVAVNLADGDLVGIMVADGDGCADGTAPTYQVELWGSFVADDSF